MRRNSPWGQAGIEGLFRIAYVVYRMSLGEACGGVLNLQLTVDDLELAVEI